MFYVQGAVFLFGAGIFLVFADGETQEWARGDKDINADNQTNPKLG